MATDAEIAAAKSIPIESEVARRRIVLKGKVDRCGPCPVCGGEDRFSINTEKQVFNCRVCERGGDVISLVRHLDGVSFLEAVERLNEYRNGNMTKPNEVLEGIKSWAKSLNGKKGNGSHHSPAVAEYIYRLADGSLHLKVLKYEPKTFLQQHWSDNAWHWGKSDYPVPYRLPELLEATGVVFVVEGEKDADRLASLGFVATTSPGGAGKWPSIFSQWFAKHHTVYVLADNDPPGRKHARDVASSLYGSVDTVRVVKLPGLPEKGDVSDWLDKGGDPNTLTDICAKSDLWFPKDAGVESQWKELPDELTRVPGLVGQIVDFIVDNARFPQRGLALGAALTIVGTAAGRQIAGPSKCGTHLYVIGLAPSGAGKNHPLTMISTIMDAAGMREHIGPGQFISMPALINFLAKTPLSVCPMDEFGAFIRRVNSKKASGFEGAISGMLRSAWGSSFSIMPTPEWAGKSRELIAAPALSIFGVSTSKEFYDSLEGSDVSNGLLNRFILIETKTKPPCLDVEENKTYEVPSHIVSGLKDILNRPKISMHCQSTIMPAFDIMKMDKEASMLSSSFHSEVRSKTENQSELEDFMARAPEQALRVAAIMSIGCGRMTVDEPTMSWAIKFITWCSNTMIEGAGLYISDSENQAISRAVLRAIKKAGGTITRSKLVRALDHKYRAQDLNGVVKSLMEGKQIAVKRERYGGATVYKILAEDSNSSEEE